MIKTMKKTLFTAILAIAFSSTNAQVKDLNTALFKGYKIGIKPDGKTTLYPKDKKLFTLSEYIKENENLFEYDGHVVKKEIFLKGNISDFKIFDSEKNYYKTRKCKDSLCGIVHLVDAVRIASDSYNLPNNPSFLLGN